MPDTVTKLEQYISKERMSELDRWIKKYPADQRQSAVMQALMLVQEEQGYLQPITMDAVAEYLQMPPIAVYEVASFYSMYKLKPEGRNRIDVCTNISCLLRKSGDVVRHIEEKLNIKLGETTADGRFTLKAVECLGACVNAPVMQVNKDYHENLTNESIDQALEHYS